MTSLSSISSSSSSSTSSTTSVSSGIGGLVSGLDTDSLVESATATSQEKIDKQEQNLQKSEWKQEAYRTVISAMQDFEDNYLDVISSTNIGSESLFNTVEASSSSDAVSVTSTASAYEGSFTINSITQLAKAETVKSGTSVTAGLSSTVSSTAITSSISSLSGKSFKLTLDGTVKTITIDSTFISNVSSDGLASAMQTAIDDAFGVTGSSDRVITVSNDSEDKLNFSAAGSTLTISAIDTDTATVKALGFTSGQSNKLSTSTELGKLSLETAPDSVSTYKFTINGVDFEFANNVSLSKMMSKVNASSAGVTMSYSNITDKFIITANDTGAGDNIVVKDTSGNLMTALKLTTDGGAVVTAGQNAILNVDGQKIIRSTNDVSINGVSVDLKESTSEAITVTMKADSTSLKDTIKKFVEDYNTMIDLINTYITDKSDSDYQPLTDAQKEDMTDEQIEKWETKAKKGILNGDSSLRSITSKLQQTMYSSVESGGISLLDLGISSAGYDENGKLEIDEDKLTTALKTKSSEISELFTSDNGLSSKLTNIFDGAIKTSGPQGSRGSLVEIAGVEDTSSATQNSIYEQMQDMNDLIDTLKDRLKDEQDRLWKKYTSMETALSNLNSQSSMLSSFGSSS